MTRRTGASDELYTLDDQRAHAYRRLLTAMEDTPASCDVTTITGMGWDDMDLAAQRKVCRRCPVKDLCLAYAELDPSKTHGVWGGKKFPRRTAAKKDPE